MSSVMKNLKRKGGNLSYGGGGLEESPTKHTYLYQSRREREKKKQKEDGGKEDDEREV